MNVLKSAWSPGEAKSSACLGVNSILWSLATRDELVFSKSPCDLHDFIDDITMSFKEHLHILVSFASWDCVWMKWAGNAYARDPQQGQLEGRKH